MSPERLNREQDMEQAAVAMDADTIIASLTGAVELAGLPRLVSSSTS
jgi:hypothetical protein